MQEVAMNWNNDAGAAIGKALKEAGQARAELGAGERWMADCMLALEAFVTAEPSAFAIEDFRAWAVPRVIDPPPSHKVWGTVPRRAIAAGIIEPIKDADGNPVYTPSRSPATHCHPVRMYRRKGKR